MYQTDTILVDPEELLFTQDSINPRFGSGSPSSTTVSNARSYAEAVALGDELLLSKVSTNCQQCLAAHKSTKYTREQTCSPIAKHSGY